MSPQQVHHDLRSGQAGTIPPLDVELDTRFRQLTEAGNQAFADGDDLEAAALYREALDEAEDLFARAEREGGSALILLGPMLLNIASHNLAAAKWRTGRIIEAHALASRATERLIETAGSATSPIALRINCVRHLGHALFFLSELDPPPGGKEEARSLDRRATEVAAEVTRIARFWLATKAADDAGDRRYRSPSS